MTDDEIDRIARELRRVRVDDEMNMVPSLPQARAMVRCAETLARQLAVPSGAAFFVGLSCSVITC